MSKLNVDQKTVRELFENKKSDFLIPDYQRPYAWGEVECQTLWDDILNFAFPDNDYSKFDSDNDEYFLGPIVTFINDDKKMEIIDGQQRLTTLMLLLRAFYTKYGYMKDQMSIKTREWIEKCIWKTDEFGNPDLKKLKIDSEVASDNDKEEFLEILKTGEAEKSKKSTYAVNYRFFQEKINEFLNCFPGFFSYLPIRILNNCILLPIEAESQDTALRIFSTLNDRGKPLSDSDIFKAQFYKFFSKENKKDEFIKQWKQLEELCDNIFQTGTGTPMDELFTRYMYYERAKLGIRTSTTEALRKFYEKDKYALLRKAETFENLVSLATFWNDIATQNDEKFSNRILRKLLVLNYAPNGMWTYFVSVYYMSNKDSDGNLDENKFYEFLDKIILFIWAYAFTNPGVNALRTPVFAEMINIVKGLDVEFREFKIETVTLQNILNSFVFYNKRPITKSMLAWWAYYDEGQELLPIDTLFEIEHIYARNRQEHEKGLTKTENIDSIGNKALLEKRINIRASDYKFVDKCKFYKGFQPAKGQYKEKTKIKELLELAQEKTDFTETDIVERSALIISTFINELGRKQLIKTL